MVALAGFYRLFSLFCNNFDLLIIPFVNASRRSLLLQIQFSLRNYETGETQTQSWAYTDS
jgi:hypothetical protein